MGRECARRQAEVAAWNRARNVGTESGGPEGRGSDTCGPIRKGDAGYLADAWEACARRSFSSVRICLAKAGVMG